MFWEPSHADPLRSHSQKPSHSSSPEIFILLRSLEDFGKDCSKEITQEVGSVELTVIETEKEDVVRRGNNSEAGSMWF